MTLLRSKVQKLKIRVPVIRPIRGLIKNVLYNTGRNNKGKLNMFHRGGGLKRRYRIVDFRHVLWNLASLVLYNEYDPNRTSLISLICYYNGILAYILSTESITTGDIINFGYKKANLTYGSFLPLMKISEGSQIHSLEITPGVGSKFVRAAGTFAILVKKFFLDKKILIRLPSKEEVLVNFQTMGVFGRVSRNYWFLEKKYKAGFFRKKGFRPIVRGVAQNPIDHPHGGGGGRCLVTAWSRVAKNFFTKKKVTLKFIVIKSRRNIKKKN